MKIDAGRFAAAAAIVTATVAAFQLAWTYNHLARRPSAWQKPDLTGD